MIKKEIAKNSELFSGLTTKRSISHNVPQLHERLGQKTPGLSELNQTLKTRTKN
jgi:hypothetical protein